jgi:hypothetical protein
VIGAQIKAALDESGQKKGVCIMVSFLMGFGIGIALYRFVIKVFYENPKNTICDYCEKNR